MWVQIPASPKNYMKKDGPLDGRKYNQNNKGSRMGTSHTKKTKQEQT